VNVVSPGGVHVDYIISNANDLCMLVFFTLRKIVPSAGPINGIQKRTTIISGFSFFNLLPTLIQLKD
jgi:hypothetical protein